MGCSHFHMNREQPDRYLEYRALVVSKIDELEWRMEIFDEKIIDVKNGKFIDNDLWHPHSRLSNLIKEINDISYHIKLIEITKYILDYLPKRYWVIISETINGRGEIKFRTGLIFMANDSTFCNTTKEYIKLSQFSAQFFEGEGMDKERCISAQKKCDEIVRLLNFS